MKNEWTLSQVQEEDALWERARAADLSRRKFLALLATGGASAVLAACAPGALPAPAPTSPPAPAPAATPEAEPEWILVEHGGPEDFYLRPPNRQETRLEAVEGLIVPNRQAFVRNHYATPVVDAETWQLVVEGPAVEQPLELTYAELLSLPSRSVLCFIECAGNFRSMYELMLNRKVKGGFWYTGAVQMAEFTGVPLKLILEMAGLKEGLPQDRFNVLIEGMDEGKFNRPTTLEKAMDEHTILAYSMNGEPLPPDHGFPVRAVLPGWVGSSNVKWVGRIVVQEEAWEVKNVTTSYVRLGPDYPTPPPVITNQTVKSTVALPWEPQAILPAGRHRIRGFAWSPYAPIAKVEYSLDKGETWASATVQEPRLPYAWVRWDFAWDATPGDYTITTRATDEEGNAQLDVEDVTWNEKGYTYPGVVHHPVKVVA